VPCTNKGTYRYQKASELHIDCRKGCSQVSEKTDMHAKDDHTCIALDLLEPSVHAWIVRSHSLSYKIAIDGNEVARMFTPLYFHKSDVKWRLLIIDTIISTSLVSIFASLHESSTELRS
jgi:hypothetical protein